LTCLDLEEEDDEGNNNAGDATEKNKSDKKGRGEEVDEAAITQHANRLNDFLDWPNIDEMIRRNKL